MRAFNKYGIKSFPIFKSGCELYHDCFTCYLPDCMEGDQRGVDRLKTQQQAQTLAQKGLFADEIAKELGKSQRTIQRYLKEGEQNGR